MTDEQWMRVLDVTLNGTSAAPGRPSPPLGPAQRVHCQQTHRSRLRAQRGQAHYAAAKAGVMALTRCAAAEAAEAGVRVNAVAPSLASTRS